ncbi:MAG TPA: glycoside hydrolase family 3 C-terminal domain-containing protein [Acidimicrobiales bacterium]|nr:glycoside hydrolase family 3 C-terminal domain-containing protein [Acidimicrobiales bacterium]
MGEDRIEDALARLTLEQKVSLLAGEDMWHTPAVPTAGVPRIKMTDGPAGARGRSAIGGPPSANVPCGTALAATWDVDVVRHVGEILGDEARAKGAHILLAPTVNIHRTPLGGRDFECMSEDPFLTARLAVAYVEGVQGRGVATCVKHFVGNDSEFERFTISSEIPERALREIYLRPFRAAIVDAGSRAIMSAYNRLHGRWCSENAALLTTILREEWGFDGLVVSDWWGTHSTADAANAGLDVEMPGPTRHRGPALVEAVRAGDVAETAVDDMVRHLLGLAAWSGGLDEDEPRAEQPERSADSPERRRDLRTAAAASFVLLRNEDPAGGGSAGGAAVLPFRRGELRTVAVIGPNAAVARTLGGGSASVTPPYAVSPLEGLRSALGDAVAVRYEPGCSIARSTPRIEPSQLRRADGGEGVDIAFVDGADPGGAVVATQQTRQLGMAWTGRPVPEVGDEWSAIVTSTFTAAWAGTHTFETRTNGRTRTWIGDRAAADLTDDEAFAERGSARARLDLELAEGESVEIRIEFAPRDARSGLELRCAPPRPDDLLERAVDAAAEADVAVVVVGMDDEWETEGRDRTTLALPGLQDELVRRVVAANPRTVVVVNTGSPVSMPWAGDVPAILQIWYPGQELGNALADVLLGDADAGGRLPTTFPVRLRDTPAFGNYPGEFGEVRYGEGLLVGYRWYDTRDIEPLFPFGHGLSYASFEYGAVTVPASVDATGWRSGAASPSVTVRVEVTNTSDRAGSEVVQVYVRDVESTVARPEKELKGFAKATFEPGETRTVEVALDDLAFAFWDPSAHAWRVEPGEFEVLVGHSSRDIRCRAPLTVTGA